MSNSGGWREGEEGEDEAGPDGLAADEHVVSPDEKADAANGEAGVGNEAVAIDAAAAETGDDFADHAHRGKDHDVNGGVGGVLV